MSAGATAAANWTRTNTDTDAANDRLAATVRQILSARRMDEDDLGEIVGADIQRAIDLWAGRSAFYISEVAMLADALEVSPSLFIDAFMGQQVEHDNEGEDG